MLDTASRLQLGETAGPIKVDAGYAIIRLNERHTTSGITGSRLREQVRRQLALEKAVPAAELENKLLEKYDAVVLQ